MSVLGTQIDAVRRTNAMRVTGVVTELRGLTVLVRDLPMPVGTLVTIRRSGGGVVHGEIVGFSRELTIVMLLGQTTGIRPGDRATAEQVAQTVPVGDRLLGRVISGLGRPIDGKGPVHDCVARRVSPDPLGALERRRICEPLYTGVRAVDLMATVGRGQRVGIFAGPGVGKSTLLGLGARNTSADVNVIALVGERGREVKEFLEECLGADGLTRSVVVVATGDQSPLLRVRAALVAATVAEHFRDAGRDVMLMMDSITRFAHAARQIGLSVGEPPTTKGYTPSVFAGLALLLERAGAVEAIGGVRAAGSITGLYTILVEGDDLTEPVSDAARGILDGHIVLARRLAHRGHYPAIDVLDSVSRVADQVCDQAHVAARRQLSRLLARYAEVEDLVQIGAYARGSDPEADIAIDFHDRINELLRQGMGETEPFPRSRARAVELALASGEAQHRLIQQKRAAAGGAGGR